MASPACLPSQIGFQRMDGAIAAKLPVDSGQLRNLAGGLAKGLIPFGFTYSSDPSVLSSRPPI